MKSVMILVLGLVIHGIAAAQVVLKVPAEITGLRDRWKWATDQAQQKGFEKHVWIAFSIDMMMEENSWIGSFHTIPEPSERSLYEIITGRHIDNPDRWDLDDPKEHARRVLEKEKQQEERKKVVKEVAFLFKFDGKPSDPSSLTTIQPTNVELDVDLQGRPLLWLGKVPVEESIGFLVSFFRDMTTSRQKQRVIVAIGIQKGNREALGFLESVVNSTESDRVRDDAVFWIGQQDSQEALDFLAKVLQTDESRHVVERAVFSVSQVHLDAATDVLINLGKNGKTEDIRKKAVFWLGQRASKKVIDTLKNFAYEGDDTEIQKQAVFALSQIHDDDAMSEIIRIAKNHPNPKVRKQAIFWLGDSGDPRAIDAIVEIAKGK